MTPLTILKYRTEVIYLKETSTLAEWSFKQNPAYHIPRTAIGLLAIWTLSSKMHSTITHIKPKREMNLTNRVHLPTLTTIWPGLKRRQRRYLTTRNCSIREMSKSTSRNMLMWILLFWNTRSQGLLVLSLKIRNSKPTSMGRKSTRMSNRGFYKHKIMSMG